MEPGDCGDKGDEVLRGGDGLQGAGVSSGQVAGGGEGVGGRLE